MPSSSSAQADVRARRVVMIDGLKVRMTAEELARRLDERVAWHRRAAAEFEVERRRPHVDREDPLMPDHAIEHDRREHLEQAGLLAMLRDHLVPGEIYELGEMDLRFADLVPEFLLDVPAPLQRALDTPPPTLES
jgi:hypothetical protein